MEISHEEKISIAESALIIVESAIETFNEIKAEDDVESLEYELILEDLKKYCKNQVRMIKGY